jgi:hypothetical protein
MRILYGIFVLCVGALVWAAVSAARHIRRHEGKAERQPPLPPEIGREAGPGEIPLQPEQAHHD